MELQYYRSLRNQKSLMEQRNYLPPADIGSLLGEFERTGQRWNRQSNSVYDDLREDAQNVDQSIRAYEET